MYYVNESIRNAHRDMDDAVADYRQLCKDNYETPDGDIPTNTRTYISEEDTDDGKILVRIRDLETGTVQAYYKDIEEWRKK